MTTFPDVVIGTILANAKQGVLRHTGTLDTMPDGDRAYFQHCCHYHWHTGTIVTLTRDVDDAGPNIHLALSFRDARPEIDASILANPYNIARLQAYLPPRPFDDAVALDWVRAIYGEHHIRTWMPAPGVPLLSEIRHWRLLCRDDFQPWMRVPEILERAVRQFGLVPFAEGAAEPKG